MQTIKFNAEIGVNEGYNVDENQKETLGIEAIGKLLQEKALKIEDATGIYVATVVSGPNRTIYKTEWGCPDGGELTFNVSSVANPEFATNLSEWKIAAILLMNEMRTALKQSTVSIEFTDKDGLDFCYLNTNEAHKDYIAEVVQKEARDKRHDLEAAVERSNAIK